MILEGTIKINRPLGPVEYKLGNTQPLGDSSVVLSSGAEGYYANEKDGAVHIFRIEKNESGSAEFTTLIDYAVDWTHSVRIEA